MTWAKNFQDRWPPVEPAVEPDEIQRWFADEATDMWRRLRPDVTPRA